jgi:hypothetical protein
MIPFSQQIRSNVVSAPRAWLRCQRHIRPMSHFVCCPATADRFGLMKLQPKGLRLLRVGLGSAAAVVIGFGPIVGVALRAIPGRESQLVKHQCLPGHR